MIQPDDELGQIDFVAEIHQLAEHALNPNLARRALQFNLLPLDLTGVSIELQGRTILILSTF